MNTIESWSKKVLEAIASEEEVEVPLEQSFEFLGHLLIAVERQSEEECSCDRCFFGIAPYNCDSLPCTRFARSDNTSVFFTEGKVITKNI
jgi:hypothetical protein